ncbi:MAG: ABC transporter substrate-binding protein [Tenericutes bacterium HGW-Tenericutes-5]|jgi:ABC-type amino acid transport substrate-binding protein|nr:MAG: ABC transporter substrate-binding protein [Tenericutes bacterium HGW-Tenericutes-5]
MKMKRFILSFTILMFGSLFIACNGETTSEATTDERETLVVGMEAAYAPFNWTIDAAGAYDEAVPIYGTNNFADGYDVMIAKLIAEELNMNLVIKAVEWEGLIPSLVTSEEIDLIIAGMSPTAERAETVAFTNEYYQSTHVVVLRADSVYNGSTSILDFSGADVVAQLGTIYDDLVVQLIGANHENPLGDVPTIITAIKEGTYDLTILELPVAQAVVESNPELTFIEFTEGNGFDISYEDSAVAIALRQGETDLLNSINAILATLSLEEREALMAEAITRQP